MPTYSFRCAKCGRVDDVFLSIREYTERPPALICCTQVMERFFTASPCRACDLFTSDAIYDGLRTLDGVDVSSRTKHRAYMKERGVTTADDFSEQWKRDAAHRADVTHGIDPQRRADIVEAIEQIKAR